MTLIVLTLLSVSGYYLKGTNCWERSFSLNLFSRNMLWQFYPWRYFAVSLSRDLMWLMKNMWLHWFIHLTINHQLAKFHGYRSCQRGYVTLLVCHVTIYCYIFRIMWLHKGVPLTISPHLLLDVTWSDDHLTLWVSYPITISHHSAKFGGHRSWGSGDILFLICHVTSRDHLVTVWCDIMKGSPHFKSLSCQVWWSQACWT